MKFILIIFFIFISKTSLTNEIEKFKGTWLCIENESAGLFWDNVKLNWKGVTFQKEKYIFKSLEDEKCTGGWGEGWNRKEQFCASFYNFNEQNELLRNKNVAQVNPRDGIYHFQTQLKWNNSNYITSGGTNYLEISDTGNFIYALNILGDVSDEGFTINKNDPKQKNLKDSIKVSSGKCSKINE